MGTRQQKSIQIFCKKEDYIHFRNLYITKPPKLRNKYMQDKDLVRPVTRTPGLEHCSRIRYHCVSEAVIQSELNLFHIIGSLILTIYNV